MKTPTATRPALVSGEVGEVGEVGEEVALHLGPMTEPTCA